MSSVDKDSNVLDDKKEAVFLNPLSETTLLTTERVTTSDEVHKRTENITTNEEDHKGPEKLEDMKEAVVSIFMKYLDNFEVQSKESTRWFNLHHEFLKISFSTLEPDLYKKHYENYIEVLDMEPYKMFLCRLIQIS